MDYVADLHLHSKYSRAVSRDMILPIMAQYARKKGLEILSIGDWTHPLWLREIKAQLTEKNSGLFQLKTSSETADERVKQIYFFLSVEISSIYSQKGKVHRIHNLVFSPGFETCEKINKELLRRGCNLSADGRPIIGLSSRDLAEMVFSIDERAMIIPAHIWTPWFSLYGANSGFDSLEECFGDMSQYIYGIETGLSSDPEMNWQIKDLETRSILSFSDAHSPAKMGREATVFRLEDVSYDGIRNAIISQSKKEKSERENKVLYTIEFYPEEGKYHYNGHRNCNVYQTPEETKAKGEICPVCHRRITVGVMQRVMDISYTSVHGITKENAHGLKWFKDPSGIHPPFVKLVPLNEIIAEAMDSTVSSMKVKEMFDKLCDVFGSEMQVLLRTPIHDIAKDSNAKIAEGVEKVRKGNIVIKPGYDGVYGVVKIWNEEQEHENEKKKQDQLGLEF